MIAGALVTAAFALVSVAVSLRHKSRIDRERADEEISVKLLEGRIKPYAELMEKLAAVSKVELSELENEQKIERAQQVFGALNKAIYGEVGVLASTLTRETILCARRRCLAYSKGACDEQEMLNAIWAVHQMLRSDLNHHQDRVVREFDRVRRKLKSNITEDVVEYLVANMNHVKFKDQPSGTTGNWWTRFRVWLQARRVLGN